MNRDMNTQVREYTEFFQGSIDPVEMEEILHRRIGDGSVRPVGAVRSSHRRGWVTAAVAAMVTVIALGSVAWLSRIGGDAPAVQTTVAVTPTTEAAITTDTVAATTTTLVVAPILPPGASGPVTIEMTRSISSLGSLSGPFEVTEGADILGCSSGTFVDTYGDVEITQLLTCSGPNTGTFTIVFDPSEIGAGAQRDHPGAGPELGDPPTPWRILDGSDDFAGLQGEGEFWHTHPDGQTAVSTYMGDIEYSR